MAEKEILPVEVKEMLHLVGLDIKVADYIHVHAELLEVFCTKQFCVSGKLLSGNILYLHSLYPHLYTAW